MPDDENDDRDRPRRRPRSEEPEEDDDYDDRPRRRRRRPAPDPLDDPAMGLVMPVNTSWVAIVAGYLGLISVLCLPAPFALLLGIIALIQVNKNPKLWGKSRAIFAIVMGGIFTLLMFVVFVMGAINGFK